ncbi:unnamed protein product [Paramecium pentaurelia]|uniref:WD domain, G-beta repeat protein n=1 Tax=Paramecium pentaurelia TaxID=43138 RepID=A0A8S1WST9_9CILI|nr:unnamed protein product [Paramecium pentaurelia]
MKTNNYQQKVDECTEAFLNQLESSFNNINNEIDSLLNLTDLINYNYQPITLTSVNTPKTNFEKLSLAQQLSQDMQSLITHNVNNQINHKIIPIKQEENLQILGHKQYMTQEIQKEKIDRIKKNQKSIEQKVPDKDSLLKPSNKQMSLLNNQSNNEKLETISSINNSNVKSFTYQLIQQYSISQNECCRAIDINKDCSILLAGCDKEIKVFEFNQGIMKLKQILSEHNNDVHTLNFMKKTNQFISGSYQSIIIWQYNQNQQYVTQQILNGHNSWIYCLILNNNEDLIISGGSDNTIKFWMKKNEWTCQQTIKDHYNSVFGLSLNQQQNRVVSCGNDKQILIIEQQQQNKEWIVTQKITVELSTLRVCFIDNDIFTLSQCGQNQISIFEMNTINKQFTKTKDIVVKCGSDGYCLFPQQYLNSKSILFSKNGEYVNLIRKKQNGEYLTEQSIHFNTNVLFGRISDDGEYLITWENKSKEIQLRRYKEQ